MSQDDQSATITTQDLADAGFVNISLSGHYRGVLYLRETKMMAVVVEYDPLKFDFRICDMRKNWSLGSYVSEFLAPRTPQDLAMFVEYLKQRQQGN